MPAEEPDREKDKAEGPPQIAPAGDQLQKPLPVIEISLPTARVLPPFTYTCPTSFAKKLPEPLTYAPALAPNPSSSPQVTVPSGIFAPRPRRDGLARWWSNGHNFTPPCDQPGFCSLKIANGTGHDAVAKLVSEAAGRLCRFVYIGAGRSVTIQGIGSGKYRLLFCTGTHWSKAEKHFRQSCYSKRFEKPVEFSEHYTATGVEYSTNEVTLHPVAGGSARTQAIPQAEFDGIR